MVISSNWCASEANDVFDISLTCCFVTYRALIERFPELLNEEGTQRESLLHIACLKSTPSHILCARYLILKSAQVEREDLVPNFTCKGFLDRYYGQGPHPEYRYYGETAAHLIAANAPEKDAIELMTMLVSKSWTAIHHSPDDVSSTLVWKWSYIRVDQKNGRV